MNYNFISNISGTITPLINDGNLDQAGSIIDASLQNIINNNVINANDIDFITDAYTFKKLVKDKNKLKTNDIMKILSSIPIDLDIQKDYNETNENYELKKSQNITTMQTFLEKYLYILIKIIFFIVCFVLLYFSTGNSISQLNINQIKEKIYKTKDETNKVLKTITTTNNNLVNDKNKPKNNGTLLKNLKNNGSPLNNSKSPLNNSKSPLNNSKSQLNNSKSPLNKT
jgi:cell division protein FtsL